MDGSIERLLYGRKFQQLVVKEEEELMDKYQLQRIDLKILLFLSANKDRNTSRDILNMGIFSRGHISQSLKRLGEKGYVSAENDADDRRFVHNYLTDQSKELVQELDRISGKVFQTVFAGFTDEEFSQLRHLAEKMEHNIQTQLES
ncbi:MarR family winged helix-turn-helix transcriptional regulator [Catenisphaera adipataccumulans]|uniref:HTH-type transcriptional regulator SarZ n=1 Tax=Catenisphaera adipataccumulans TaxID=700500 RepID=A0A7W8CYW9_9FIRM|nr:MarR family transcriptional regulator [Catenisphaera adipataccumulans]MBB5182837.1 DNA-binding MarR family transcriptional regulator [Catenisphaera adipataccumulans]